MDLKRITAIAADILVPLSIGVVAWYFLRESIDSLIFSMLSLIVIILIQIRLDEETTYKALKPLMPLPKNRLNIERFDRERSYKDLTDRISHATKRILIVQRTPSVLFEPQGTDPGSKAEEGFNKLLRDTVFPRCEKGELILLYGFNHEDSVYVHELEKRKGSLKAINDAMEEWIELDNKTNGQIRLFTLGEEHPKKATVIAPMSIVDDVIRIETGTYYNERIAVTLKDVKICDSVFELYRARSAAGIADAQRRLDAMMRNER